MVPSIYGENMFDEFFDNNGFFGSHSPLFGKNSKNLMKTDNGIVIFRSTSCISSRCHTDRDHCARPSSVSPAGAWRP